MLETLNRNRNSLEWRKPFFLNSSLSSLLEPHWKTLSGSNICQSPAHSVTTHMSQAPILLTLSLTSLCSNHSWAPIIIFWDLQTRQSELSELWGMTRLTSKRRYSFCSWESRLTMTPEAARVRKPTRILVCRAGNDHKSWNWMWLRPSKENSGAACQSETQRLV